MFFSGGNLPYVIMAVYRVHADQHTLACEIHGWLCGGRVGASTDDELVDGV